MPQRIRAGCDLQERIYLMQDSSLPQRIRAGCDVNAPTLAGRAYTLPQRIRAGCDCGKAMQRTANLLREGR